MQNYIRIHTDSDTQLHDSTLIVSMLTPKFLASVVIDMFWIYRRGLKNSSFSKKKNYTKTGPGQGIGGRGGGGGTGEFRGQGAGEANPVPFGPVAIPNLVKRASEVIWGLNITIEFQKIDRDDSYLDSDHHHPLPVAAAALIFEIRPRHSSATAGGCFPSRRTLNNYEDEEQFINALREGSDKYTRGAGFERLALVFILELDLIHPMGQAHNLVYDTK
ncbi:hypothetical protein LXL04_028977 [Taraxacum kok-saghyz]